MKNAKKISATVIENEVANVYFSAIETRIASEVLKARMTDKNIAILAKAQAIYKSEKIVNFMIDNSCYASFSTQDVYEIEKMTDFLLVAETGMKRINPMNYVIFKTCENFAKAEKQVTVNDIRAACSKDGKSDNQELIVQRDTIVGASTINAQHRSTMQALINLRVLSPIAGNAKAFTVNTENTIYKALTERLAA